MVIREFNSLDEIKKEYNSYFYNKVIPENKKGQIDINDFLFRKN